MVEWAYAVYEYISTEYPHWTRYGGKDHIWVSPQPP